MIELLCTIDLMRHGEPQGGNQFRGSKDDPLSELGWEQMHTSIKQFHDWSLVASSPMLRCKEFAKEINKSGKDILLFDDMRELHFGDWEGKTPAEINELYPHGIKNFWSNPLEYEINNAESILEFQQRINNAWSSLVETSYGENALLVCHGGVIRMILCQILGMPLTNLWRVDVPYAAISRIRVIRDHDHVRSELIFHNGINPKSQF